MRRAVAKVAWLLAVSLVLASASVPSHAQTAIATALPPISQLRQMIERPEVVVVVRRKAYPAVSLEGGGSITVSAVGAFEPGDEEHRTMGLRIDVGRKGLPHREGRTYLDPHEAQKLVKALSLIAAVAAEGSQLETEADFATNEGFAVGVRVRGGKSQYHISAGRTETVEAHLSGGGFAALKKHVQDALDGLFN